MRETSKTGDHALRVLLELGQRDGLTLDELAARLEVSRGVGSRLISTLRGRSMVTRDDAGRFFLGPGLIAVAASIPSLLASAAQPELAQLAARHRETVVLSVRAGDDAKVVSSTSGSNGPLRIEYEAGYSHPMTAGASGLAILAHLDLETRERLLPGGDEQLGQIRARGYALSEGSVRMHMVGISVPIFDGSSSVTGSIAIVVPSSRATGLEDLSGVLQASARRIGEHVDVPPGA